MTDRIQWLTAREVEVGGTARPNTYHRIDGTTNDVAAVRISSIHNGDGLVLEGRPEDLVATAREFLRAAEQIVEVTMRDPDLRRMYGIVHDPKPAGGFITVELGKLPTSQAFLPEAVMRYVDQQRALGKTNADILDEAMDAYMRGDLDGA